jgi:hypothetical protein
MQTTTSKYLASFKNKAGEKFELFWSKCQKPIAADYRRYIVEARRAHRSDDDENRLSFQVIITKAAFPEEEAALELLKTEVLREIKARLELATKDEGPPLLLPPDLGKNGWSIT